MRSSPARNRSPIGSFRHNNRRLGEFQWPTIMIGTSPSANARPLLKPAAAGAAAAAWPAASCAARRHETRRSWLYRMRPPADHPPFVAYDGAPLFGAMPSAEPLAPNRLRWDPPADLPEGTDFVDGLVTMLHARTPEELE